MRLFEFIKPKQAFDVNDFFFYNSETDIDKDFTGPKIDQLDFGGDTDLAFIKYTPKIAKILKHAGLKFFRSGDNIKPLMFDTQNYGRWQIVTTQRELQRCRRALNAAAREYGPTEVDANTEALVQFIRSNCQPYLRENPKLLNLYRGTDSYSENLETGARSKAFVKPVRPNRMPKDSSKAVDDFMQMLLSSKGLTATRRNSVFAIGALTNIDGQGLDITEYGRPWIIFPIGEFHYTWAPKIKDLQNLFNHDPSDAYLLFQNQKANPYLMKRFLEDDYRVKSLRDPNLDPAAVERLGNYFQGDDGSLSRAIAARREILIHCNKVLYVEPKLAKSIRNLLVG